MDVLLKDYKDARKGDVLVYDGKFWRPIPHDELLRNLKTRVDDLEKSNEGRHEVERIKLEKEKAERYAKHFSKEHFALVFNHVRFILVSGIETLEVDENEFLPLYDKVMNNELTVEQAINRFQVLKDSFIKVFGELGE